MLGFRAPRSCYRPKYSPHRSQVGVVRRRCRLASVLTATVGKYVLQRRQRRVRRPTESDARRISSWRMEDLRRLKRRCFSSSLASAHVFGNVCHTTFAGPRPLRATSRLVCRSWGSLWGSPLVHVSVALAARRSVVVGIFGYPRSILAGASSTRSQVSRSRRRLASTSVAAD